MTFCLHLIDNDNSFLAQYGFKCFFFLVILPELLENFERASAEVTQCPDLTRPPFNLVSEGLKNCFKING